ncbi:hypothetical protein B296_00012734 [Ensete ventricosum]|uniref:Uncharacterized protein n=1 Tax=Ensete ventricosum TaxID=4639 RepID=A0A426YVI1_ENSVE|nr:hypothetical protein B296_00012734 [Ensete ventricosum]
MKSHSERRDKRRYCRFHSEYDHDTEECRTSSIKSKTSSGADTCADMSATNPHSLIVDPLETRHPDPKVRSRSKSTSSSVGQPRAVIAPRCARPMHDLRSGRDRRMTKTPTSHLTPISVQRHHRSSDPQPAQGGRFDLSPASKVPDPSRG